MRRWISRRQLVEQTSALIITPSARLRVHLARLTRLETIKSSRKDRQSRVHLRYFPSNTLNEKKKKKKQHRIIIIF